MNLDEFLKENPDTLGCLTQKYLRFYWKAFPSPVHVLWKWDKNTDMTKYKLLSASSSCVLAWGLKRGRGGNPTKQTNNTLRHPESWSPAIDFVFNQIHSHNTTQPHWLFFFRLLLNADGMVNYLIEKMFSGNTIHVIKCIPHYCC